MTEPKPATVPLWAKCTDCAHVWVAAYLPQLVETLCKILRASVCPKCGGRARVAKQADGKLQEPEASS